MKRTASFESLHDPQRNYTRVIFIDAVEPKNHRTQPPPSTDPRFPDTIEVSYAIATNFREPHDPRSERPGRAVGDFVADHDSAGAGAEDRFRRSRAFAVCPERQILRERAAAPASSGSSSRSR